MQVYVKFSTGDAYTVLRRLHGKDRAFTGAEDDIQARYAAELLRRVLDIWPVDTGTSRDAWEVSTDVSPGSTGIILYNPMYYTSFVFYAGDRSKTPVVDTELRDIWADIKPRLISDLVLRIVRTEQAIGPDKSRANTRKQYTTAR